MENDELKEFLKMDFPDYKVDNEKIISLCRKSEKKNRVSKSIIFKLALGLSCVIMVMITLFVNYNNINRNNLGGINNTIIVDKGEGFKTTFTGYESGNSKISLGFDIGYKTDGSVFNIDEVYIELLIGHFLGPCSEFVNEGQVDDTYSFDFDSWKGGPYYSNERASQYGNAKIFIRTELYPTTVEEEVYSVDNFYDNYLFIYTMANYENGKYKWFQYENIEPRDTIKNFFIDKKFFKKDAGEISIGIGFNGGGEKYVNLFYYKDIDNNMVYLSCKSIEDAERKYIDNSKIETKYTGYESVFQ